MFNVSFFFLWQVVIAKPWVLHAALCGWSSAVHHRAGQCERQQFVITLGQSPECFGLQSWNNTALILEEQHLCSQRDSDSNGAFQQKSFALFPLHAWVWGLRHSNSVPSVGLCGIGALLLCIQMCTVDPAGLFPPFTFPQFKFGFSFQTRCDIKNGTILQLAVSPVNASSPPSFSVTLHGWQAVSYLLAFFSPSPQIAGGNCKLPLLWVLPRSEAHTLCFPSCLWCVSFLWMLCPFIGLPVNKSSSSFSASPRLGCSETLINAFSMWVHLAWSVRKQQFQQLNVKN